MKRIRRRKITIQREEIVFIRQTAGVNEASSEDEILNVCPTCGTHFPLAVLLPESSAAPEVTAYSAAELPPAITCEHDGKETEKVECID